jgi:NADH-quinone oxidoreductase subunit E
MTYLLNDIPVTDPIQDPSRKAMIDTIIESNRNRQGATMVVLNEIQGKIGFISKPMQAYIAQQLKVPLGAIHGVVTFYSFFTTKPRGKHCMKFCMGTACYVGGTPQLIEKAKQTLGIDIGDTTDDGELTLEVCRCVGACSQAPVVVVDDEVSGRVRPNKFPQLLRRFQTSVK